MSSVRPNFSLVQRFSLVRPNFSLGDGEMFRFWDDDWSRHGQLCGVFPCLYALSTDPGGLVRQAWHDTWVLALPSALID